MLTAKLAEFLCFFFFFSMKFSTRKAFRGISCVIWSEAVWLNADVKTLQPFVGLNLKPPVTQKSG